MNIAVRYYSRKGHTKAVADAIAKAAGVSAVSVGDSGAEINEPVDMLFIGGALYAHRLDKHLKDYLGSIKGENVKKAAVFSTAGFSKHAIDLIKKGLAEKGIDVEEEFFYAKSMPSEAQLKEAEAFAAKFL